jgi:hypothetical protein
MPTRFLLIASALMAILILAAAFAWLIGLT